HRRVAEAIKEEVADILRSMQDPRIGFASVVAVEMSPDLAHARVYVSVLGDRAAQEASLRALTRAAGLVRRELGQRIRLRHTPEIDFRLDESLAHGDRIHRLLREIHAQEEHP
ncbi:MAG: 30S ribosome-binding factor RbfA, partial [Conexivisphaerales archaeon]